MLEKSEKTTTQTKMKQYTNKKENKQVNKHNNKQNKGKILEK